MKNLTVEQKNIISTIENEFIAMNNSNISNAIINFIDVDALNEEYNRIMNGKKELEIYNKGMRVVTNKTMDDYIAKINADFKNGNVPLEAVKVSDSRYYNRGLKIQFHVGESNRSNYSLYDFRFEVNINESSSKTEFGEKLDSNFRYSIYTEHNRINDNYQSFEECVASNDFKEKINRLYSSMSEGERENYLWK